MAPGYKSRIGQGRMNAPPTQIPAGAPLMAPGCEIEYNRRGAIDGARVEIAYYRRGAIDGARVEIEYCRRGAIHGARVEIAYRPGAHECAPYANTGKCAIHGARVEIEYNRRGAINGARVSYGFALYASNACLISALALAASSKPLSSTFLRPSGDCLYTRKKASSRCCSILGRSLISLISS